MSDQELAQQEEQALAVEGQPEAQPAETEAVEAVNAAETPTADVEEAETPPAEAVEAAPVAEVAAEDAAADSSSDDDAEDDDANTIFNLEPRQQISGTVKNITSFGAFVDLGLPQDGLVHISELARRKVEKVDDVVSVGQAVDVWVKKVDRKRGRISLTMIKPVGRRIRDIDEGEEVTGVVTRLEPYGAFVNIDSERDGLVHISQITHGYIKHPEEALSVGDEVQVKVLKVNRKKRQVDLSIKDLVPPPQVETPAPVAPAPKQKQEKAEDAFEAEEEPMPTAMAVAFASLQEQTDDEANGAPGASTPESHKRKQEQADIIARTLGSNK